MDRATGQLSRIKAGTDKSATDGTEAAEKFLLALGAFRGYFLILIKVKLPPDGRDGLKAGAGRCLGG